MDPQTSALVLYLSPMPHGYIRRQESVRECVWGTFPERWHIFLGGSLFQWTRKKWKSNFSMPLRCATAKVKGLWEAQCKVLRRKPLPPPISHNPRGRWSPLKRKWLSKKSFAKDMISWEAKSLCPMTIYDASSSNGGLDSNMIVWSDEDLLSGLQMMK